MALHLIKLCVGTDSIADLEGWIARRAAQAAKAGANPFEHVHRTRQRPKRKQELLDNGSLYWVIKGYVQARQRLLDIRPITDKEGVQRCELVLDPAVIATRWQPRRPFQGWRYLAVEDAPADLSEAERQALAMQAELSALGLL